jgi:hypothetical protein
MLRDLLQQYERGIPSRSEAIDFLGSVDLLINAKSTTDPGDEEGAMFLLGDGLKCLFSEIIDWTMAEFSIPDSSEFCLSFQQPN